MRNLTLKIIDLLCDIDTHQNLKPSKTQLCDKDRHQESYEAITNNETRSNMHTHPTNRTNRLQFINKP